MVDHSTPLWTSDEAERATGGKTNTVWEASGVSIDSRTIVPGDLFVAIVGPHHDGHQFVEKALAAGAAAAIISHLDPSFSDSPDRPTNLLYVENTTVALEGLARAARARTAAKIIAVTGSVGKTSIKEMLRLVLSDQGKTFATAGNLNNHWGLPLSLARMPADTEFGVFEMGMNHKGEILPLTQMARPHVAMISTIEPVHSEFFASIEEIADAKAEIFFGVEPLGCVVLNGDNQMLSHLSKAAVEAGVSDIRIFGTDADADCRLVNAALGATESVVNAELRGKQFQFELNIPGRHWMLNALGVLCAVDSAGADAERAASRLKDMEGLKGRGCRYDVSIPDGRFVLIDESYNASPVSMKAAIAVLGQSKPSAGGRKIAVLGDMLELGAGSDSIHAGLAETLIDNAIDLVFTTGEYMAALSSALPSHMRAGHANSVEKLSPLVCSSVRSGDVVTVKGSFGSRTGEIVKKLLELENHSPSDGPAPQAVNGN